MGKLVKISMKRFDPKNLPEGIWTPFLPGVDIQIRKLNASIIQELKKPITEKKMMINALRIAEEVDFVDPEKWNDVLADYVVQNYRGFGDDDGNPLPVTLVAKKAMLGEKQISAHVMSVAEAVEMVEAKKEEAEIKN